MTLLKQLADLIGWTRTIPKKSELHAQFGAFSREISEEEHQALLTQRRIAAKSWSAKSKPERDAIRRAQREKFAQIREDQRCKLGITHYIFHVSVPEKADPRCLGNDNKTFAFDCPPETGNPGEDKCSPVDGVCRCFASQIIPGFNS